MSAIDSDITRLLGASERRPRLLIVDDQPHNIQLIHKLFSDSYQVFMATSGEKGLEVAKEQLPDLMLVDVVMEGMDGYELCRQIKRDSRTQDIPVIFITSHSDPKEETMGLNVGAVDFITKPINPDVVKARVRTHVRLKFQSDILRNMVFLDGLTGVFNRRYFDHHLPLECLRAARDRKPMSLLMIDVDYFKRFNDHYGHQAGDDCLKRVAQALRAAVKRPADAVVRYGGEEFACLLPDTDLSGALQVANHLEAQVRALCIPHEHSEVLAQVTISIGVATRDPGDEPDGESLLARADANLYKAKVAGRARVCSG